VSLFSRRASSLKGGLSKSTSVSVHTTSTHSGTIRYALSHPHPHPHPAAGYLRNTRALLLIRFLASPNLSGPIVERRTSRYQRHKSTDTLLRASYFFPQGVDQVYQGWKLLSQDSTPPPTTPPSPPSTLPRTRRNGGCGAADSLNGHEASRHFLRLRREPPACPAESVRLSAAQRAQRCTRSAQDLDPAMPQGLR
jgi:hypothetical protein